MSGARRRVAVPWATLTLVLVMLALQAWSMSRLDAPLQERYGISAVGWRAWQPATYAVVHTTWAHLLGNLALLGLYGPGTERRLKGWGLLLVFFGSAVAGGLAHIFFGPGNTPVVGASGAVSGILAARAVAVPADRIHVIGALLWAGANVAGWASDPQAERGLAYASHLGGFLAGAVAGAILKAAVAAPKSARPF